MTLFKEQVDIIRAIDAASHIENVPQAYRQFYILRAQNLRKIGNKILNSKVSNPNWERDFISLVLADPTQGTSTANWAKKGKILARFEAHHGAPLKFNKQVLAYAPPEYHFKTNGYLKSNHDIELGNTKGNRYSTHKVAHIGSKDIVSGPGSVAESLHPKGTNEGFWTPPSHKDVSPKEYSDLIAEKNGSMIQTAKTVYNNPDGLSQAIRNEAQKYTDLDLKTAEPVDVNRQINRYRRQILDRVELKFGGITLKAADPLSIGLDTAIKAVKQNPTGAAIGAASFIEPEAVKSALQGDVTGAVKQTAMGATTGALVQQGIKQAAPVVTQAASRVLPKFAMSLAGGAAKFVPPVAAGVAGFQMLDAIVEGATGSNIQETGKRAEQKKEQLKQQGYSKHDLRRRARTGYKKPL